MIWSSSILHYCLFHWTSAEQGSGKAENPCEVQGRRAAASDTVRYFIFSPHRRFRKNHVKLKSDMLWENRRLKIPCIHPRKDRCSLVQPILSQLRIMSFICSGK